MTKILVSVAGSGVLGLLLASSGCSSDSTGAGAGGKGGASTSTGGSSANGGKSSTGGSSADGGAEDGATGGSATGGSATGGSATGGKPSGGSASGGETSSGGGIWGCVEAGGACICQNNTDKAHESVCTATYKCCVTLPFAGAIRCQCQDPGNKPCEAPAGSGATVVDKCPPP